MCKTANCPIGYAGRYFYLAFPENLGLGSLQLYITSATSQTATVQVSAPLQTGTWSGASLIVSQGSSQMVTVPVALQLSGLNIESKAIYISASSNIVVFARNRYSTFCGSFQVIPLDFLSTSYHAITTWPDSMPDSFKNSGNVAVVATAPGTTSVTFTFPQGRGISITYNNIRYTAAMTVTLNQYQTFQLQDNANLPDLTGTLVTATQPVAVFSGNIAGNVINDNGDYPVSDHSVEQMIPTTAYGTTFYAVEFPGQATSDTYLRIVCRDDSTTVYVNGQVLGSCNAQGVLDTIQTSQQFLVVTSTKPVTVGQINEGQGTRSQGTPAIVVVPPVTSYLSTYTFVVPSDIDQATLILVVPNAAQNGIQLNGVQPNTQWTVFANTNVYGVRISVSPGTYTVQHASNAVFGAYVYGRDSADTCSVTYAAGMNVGTVSCGVS